MSDDTALSPLALRLWRLLDERPGRYELNEIKRDLKCSKTALLAALHELDEAGIVSFWMEANDE